MPKFFPIQPIERGGTNANTKTNAFDNLAPTTTAGDIIFHNGTDNVRLAPNATATRRFLMEASSVLSWELLAATDLAAHVLADTVGLGAQHTVSGLTARQVLIATGATAALFRALQSADLPAHTHATTDLTGTLQAAQFPALTGDITTSAGSLVTTIADSAIGNIIGAARTFLPRPPTMAMLAHAGGLGPSHFVQGLISGHVLRATGASSAQFGALVAGDLPSHTHAGPDITIGLIPAARMQEVLALADLTDVSAKTGTGTVVVMQNGPVIKGSIAGEDALDFIDAISDNQRFRIKTGIDIADAPQFQAFGVGTDIHINMVPKGAGRLQVAGINVLTENDYGNIIGAVQAYLPKPIRPDYLIAGSNITLTRQSGAITIASTGGGVSDHGLLTGLADDDHSQYVHISTARTITAEHTIGTDKKLFWRDTWINSPDVGRLQATAGTSFEITSDGTLVLYSFEPTKFRLTNSDALKYLELSIDVSGADFNVTGSGSQVDFLIDSAVEMTLAANRLTFNAGATDPALDWATSAQLSVYMGATERWRFTNTNAGFTIGANLTNPMLLEAISGTGRIYIGTAPTLFIQDNNLIFYQDGTNDPKFEFSLADRLSIWTGGAELVRFMNTDVTIFEECIFTGGKGAIFSSGAAPTQTEGAVWNDSTQKCLTTFVDGLKQYVPGVLFTKASSDVTVTSVTGSTTDASLVTLPQFPTNFFVANKTTRWRAAGRITRNTGGAGSLRLYFRIQEPDVTNVTLLDTGTISGAEWTSTAYTDRLWHAWGECTCRTTGGTGTIQSQGAFAISADSGSGITGRWETAMVNTAATTFDSIAAQTPDLRCALGAHTTAPSTFILTNFSLEALE